MPSRHRKPSETIELVRAADVLAALRHAIHIGLAPNRHMTINLAAAGIMEPVTGIGRLMKLMCDGARRHGHVLSYVWVREVGDTVGEHVHILVHVPPALSDWFKRRKAGWMRRVGARRARGISLTRVIHGAQVSPGYHFVPADVYAINLRNVTAYVLKHCSPDVQRHLGIASDGPCHVSGKRVSISQNLHRTARTRCAQCTSVTS